MTVSGPLGSFWTQGLGMRAQPVTTGSDASPNLTVRAVPGAVDLGDCPDRYTVGVAVVNRGSAMVPAGVTVSTLAPGNQNASITAQTTRRLNPGDQEVVLLTFQDLLGPVDVECVVSREPGQEVDAPECRTDDNLLVLTGLGCAAP